MRGLGNWDGETEQQPGAGQVMLVMLWKGGAAAEGTPGTAGTAGTPRAAGWPGEGEGGESSSPPLNLCAFLRKNPAGSSRAKACECHPVSAARGPRGGTARLGGWGGGHPENAVPQCPHGVPAEPSKAASKPPAWGAPKRPAPLVKQQRHPSQQEWGDMAKGARGEPLISKISVKK